MRKLSSYIGRYWYGYVFAVASMVTAIALDMLYPKITQKIVDDVILGGQMEILTKLLTGIVLVGIGRSIFSKKFDKGIWYSGIGTVFTVLSLLLVAGYNDTAYYPSAVDLQSSLTLANSSSSLFTLKTMAYVSILVPFVLAYIFYAWRSIDNRKIDTEEINGSGHAY